jgi:hypothetical protein
VNDCDLRAAAGFVPAWRPPPSTPRRRCPTTSRRCRRCCVRSWPS